MNYFTLSKSGKNIIAQNVSSQKKLTIKPNDSKFEKVLTYLNAGKLLSISEAGRWSGRQDYEGYYKTQTSVKPVNVTFTKLADLNIDDSLFNPMPTNTVFDKFVSNEGGFLPGTNIMAAGAPGVGKTTVLLELLSNLHAAGKKVLFISAEMSQIDMARYLQRFPNWGQLPILFLGDYVEQCPQKVVESALDQGWDLVLTDSYTEVNDTVKEACNLTRSKTEKWFLDLMIKNNKAQNKGKKYTTFVTILQLSKGGQFVGSNKLKHMTTSMLHLDWEGGENGRRFMEFSKNRCGQVGKKLYFSIGSGVELDEARYARDLFNDQLVADERKQLESESDAFDKLFGLGTENVIEAEASVEA